MRYLAARITIDGNLQKGVVVDVSDSDEVLSLTPLAAFPHEPANTRYVPHLTIEDGHLSKHL